MPVPAIASRPLDQIVTPFAIQKVKNINSVFIDLYRENV
jgi:hypothetical protein